jgi:hypothetical protein
MTENNLSKKLNLEIKNLRTQYQKIVRILQTQNINYAQLPQDMIMRTPDGRKDSVLELSLQNDEQIQNIQKKILTLANIVANRKIKTEIHELILQDKELYSTELAKFLGDYTNFT